MERLPTKRFKRLTALNWTRQDLADGKHLELKKNIAYCQKWIQTAFNMLPQDMQAAFVNEDKYKAIQEETAEKLAKNKNARMLGQYFSHITSIDMLLNVVFALPFDLNTAIFLEPSCGAGNFFQPLLDRGAKQIVGHEIDTEVAAVTKSTAPTNVRVESGNFLESKMPCDCSNRDVIVVGGPPYTALTPGGDIVLDFFKHCAQEWHAKVIGFILPDRCTKPAYLEKIADALTPAFKCHHVAAIPESFFDFKGKQVRQPSSVVVYTRVDN